jgi:hypothetical protein
MEIYILKLKSGQLYAQEAKSVKDAFKISNELMKDNPALCVVDILHYSEEVIKKYPDSVEIKEQVIWQRESGMTDTEQCHWSALQCGCDLSDY